MGVCKYFSCNFSYQSCLEWIKAYEKLNLIRIESALCDNEVDYTYVPTGKSKNQYTHPFGLTDNELVTESFLLPNAEKRYRLKFPFEYMGFLMIATDINYFYKLKMMDLPPIDIEMQYSDVQGKAYKQTAQIEIVPFSTTVSNKGTLQYIYDISAKEIV